jgi:dihydroflavonol-4-reductase
MTALHALPKLAAVTGGSGFIGAHVVRLLLGEGVAVRVLALPGDPCELLEGLDVEIVRGDLLTGEGFDALLSGADGLFHLAAIYVLLLKDPTLMRRVNVEGTGRLLEAALRHGVTRVVYTSSIAAVATLPGEERADETHAFDPTGIDELYVLSKGESELLALGMADRLDIVAVNPSFPVGPGDLVPTPTGRLVRELAAGKLPARFPGGINVVDVRDCARGHILAYQRGQRGQRYILGGHDVSNDELVDRIASLAGRRPPRFRLPAALIIGASVFYELWARITGEQPLMTRASARHTVGRFLYFDNRKAREELGFESRALDETLGDAVTWFADRA